MERMRRILPLAAIGLVISFCTGAEALGSSPVGNVIALRGTAVAVDSRGGTRELALKDPVYLQDTVKTEKRSRIQVMFTDNTIASLGPEAEMKIADYEWKPDENTGTLKTKIKEGVFRLMGGSIAKKAPENFTTETPAATIGIRGSMYAGRVSGDSLTVLFQGGKGIFVANAAGTVDITVPGFGTIVENRLDAPKPPEKFTVEQITAIDKAISGTSGGTEPENGNRPAESEKKDGSNEDSDSSDSEGVRESESPETDSEGNQNQNDSGKGSGEGKNPNPDNTPPGGSEGEEPLTAEGGSKNQEGTSQPDGDGRLSSIGSAEPFPDPGAGLAGTRSDSPVSNSPAPSITDTLTAVKNTAADTVQQSLDTTAARTIAETATTTTVPATTTTIRETTTTEIATTTTTTTEMVPTTTTTVPEPVKPPAIANFTSGKMLALLTDTNTSTNLGDAEWSGDASATSTDGSVEGSGTTGGKSFPFAFTIAPYDSSAPYSSPSSYSKDRTISLNGQDQTFSNGMAVKYEPLGEFAYYLLPNTAFDSGNYSYQELGFFGIPSTSVPADGVDNYTGDILAAITKPATLSAASGQFSMEINWKNQKVLGRIQEGTDSYYFFGDLSGTQLANIQFCGGEGGAIPDAKTSSTVFSQIYGSRQQGVGVTITGSDFSIQSQGAVATWKAIAAGFLESEPASTSPTGNALWKGFFTGLAENMASPATDRRLYLNSSADAFQFNLDKGAGTITGNLSGDDLLGSGYQISSIQIGDTNGSAFILADNLIAGLGGAAVIVNGGNTGDLSEYGNFLVSMPPEDQFSTYVTWGYWEAAYIDPVSSAVYHLHRPGSYWIAGSQTPFADVQDLIDGGTFQGTYTGPAYGIKVDANPNVTELTNGAANLTVDFSKVAVNDALTGSISFNEIGFTVASNPGAITNSGFTANFSNSTAGAVASSQLNGAFFGPAANAVAGNFNAEIGGDRYIGIFGGNR